MKVLHSIKFATIAGLLLSGSAFAAGTIVGSAHDLRSSDLNVAGAGTDRVCVFCHTPHNATPPSVNGGPLWNRATNTQTYTYYNNSVSSTLNGTVGTVGPESKACLGCHDGSLAIDSVVNAPGTETWNGSAVLTNASYAYVGTDLSNDHPIAITYTTATASADGGLKDPGTNGASLVGVETFSDKVECASCHEVHNATGFASLLLVDNQNSALCTSCHNK